MAFEKYSIRQFREAMFNGDRTVMNDEILKNVNTEYIDVSGLFDNEEFEKVSRIHYLNNRINSIAIAIKLQREFVNNFEKAYIPGLSFFKKFGHNIYWNDINNFLLQLEKIEGKEKRFIVEIEIEIKNLIDSRAKKNSKEKQEIQSRGSFIRTINSLGKLGYNIDNDKTTVEELAYMIKQQLEENSKSK